MTTTTIEPMPAIRYTTNATGWTVRLIDGEALLGYVEMPSVQAGTWDAWAPASGTLPLSLVSAELPGRNQAAEALWRAYSARKADER
jgi:hypothetical protein